MPENQTMHDHGAPYRTLALNSVTHLIAMFLLTYVMLETLSHFHANLNRFYMAVLMVAPMLVTMPLTMRSMYRNARLNRLLIAGAVMVFALVLALVRTQTPIGDTAFLRSMIPHHSSAVLMCREASITDAEILRLCDTIVRTQLEEIAQMERILSRM